MERKAEENRGTGVGVNRLSRCHWDHSSSAGKRTLDGGLADASRWTEAIHGARVYVDNAQAYLEPDRQRHVALQCQIERGQAEALHQVSSAAPLDRFGNVPIAVQSAKIRDVVQTDRTGPSPSVSHPSSANWRLSTKHRPLPSRATSPRLTFSAGNQNVASTIHS